jgi:hypothetical protein
MHDPPEVPTRWEGWADIMRNLRRRKNLLCGCTEMEIEVSSDNPDSLSSAERAEQIFVKRSMPTAASKELRAGSLLNFHALSLCISQVKVKPSGILLSVPRNDGLGDLTSELCESGKVSRRAHRHTRSGKYD